MFAQCFKEKNKIGIEATCGLNDFALANDSNTSSGIPDATVIQAGREMWADNPFPAFLNRVIVSVTRGSFMRGNLQRRSDDVPIRSLVYQIYQASLARDQPLFDRLLNVAKSVPILLRYEADPVDGWYIALERNRRQELNKKFSQDTLLAWGATYDDITTSPRKRMCMHRRARKQHFSLSHVTTKKKGPRPTDGAARETVSS